MAAGVLVLMVNLFWTHFKGQKVGPNPWSGDSLEWAVESPPVNYGFQTLPVVRGRHPLWEQQDNQQEEEGGGAKLVKALARWPLTWRAALVTSTLEARPQEVFRVSGPSIWPFFTALGTIFLFAAEIFNFHIVALSGILIIIISLAVWHWPEESPAAEEELEAFEKEHGVTLWMHGSRSVGRAGMMLLNLILWVALADLLFSYFYLRLVNTEWPLGNVSLPSVWVALLSGGLMLLSGSPVYWAARRARSGDNRRLAIGLGAAFLLGAAALSIQVFEFTRLDFQWDTNAYGSAFYTLGAYAFLVLVGALLMSALTQFWAWRKTFTPRRHVMVENVTLFWYSAILLWLVVFGVLYLTPYWM